jgi:hypothetical protein
MSDRQLTVPAAEAEAGGSPPVAAARATLPAGVRNRGVAALLAALTVSVAIGFIGSRHGTFDWELAAVVGTALGTTLLALTTGWLAYLTSRDVGATQELAQLTKRDQDERERPEVVLQQDEGWIEGRVDPEGGGLDGEVELELRNVGLGPALTQGDRELLRLRSGRHHRNGRSELASQ